MSQPLASRVGGVISADIAVPEHERELSFYSRVLTTGDAPFWREDLMNSQGTPIIGLGKRIPEYEMLPLQWMPHIQVADVAATIARAQELGGEVLLKDESGKNQWGGLRDPDGAAFGVIPVVPAESIPTVEGGASSSEPGRAGCIGWLDLTVPGASASRDFYRQVVGWAAEDVEMKDGGESYADYNMLGGDGNPAAGVCHARGVNAGLPAVWLIYLPVGDLGESLRRVEDGGGEVLRSNRGSDGGYTSAVIRDPVGVCLALVQG